MFKKFAIMSLCGLFSFGGFVFCDAAGASSSQDFVRKAVVNEAKREAKSEAKEKASEKLPSLVKPSISAKEARKLAVKHGHTGYKDLPPGIVKNLGRGKPLPPGIARKAAPEDFLAELPGYSGYDWLVAGKDLILVRHGGGGLIADVLRGVFK